jgi:hypothetical protein
VSDPPYDYYNNIDTRIVSYRTTIVYWYSGTEWPVDRFWSPWRNAAAVVKRGLVVAGVVVEWRDKIPRIVVRVGRNIDIVEWYVDTRYECVVGGTGPAFCDIGVVVDHRQCHYHYPHLFAVVETFERLYYFGNICDIASVSRNIIVFRTANRPKNHSVGVDDDVTSIRRIVGDR